MTTEKEALELVAEALDVIGKRLESHDEVINAINAQILTMIEQIDKLGKRITELEGIFDLQGELRGKRITKLEHSDETTTALINGANRNLREHDLRITVLERGQKGASDGKSKDQPED